MLYSWIFGGPVALGGGLALQTDGGQAFTRQKYGGSTSHIVDDCITCGTTDGLCDEALLVLGNHVDGLMWVAL